MGTHSTDNKYACTGCGKTFTTLGTLNKHKRIHTGDKSEVCNICHVGFYYKAHLKVHLLTYGEKHFFCETCSRGFTNMAAKLVHERQHTGDRPHSYKTCDKSFTTKSSLKQHNLGHRDSRFKPFLCSTCGKSFVSVTHLKNHEHLHCIERPFVCGMCDKTSRIDQC